MSLALYREFRPKNFDDVIGQDYIIQTLKNQVKTGHLSHAYLFCGPRGTGKTSTAKIFARAVNCTHSTDGNPCDMCAECVALSQPNTDIFEIDAASNNRVEEIRDLREKVAYPPLIGKYKVYIVDEVHMLTDSAFNALLKTLEEPPQHVIFILATTEIHKLPATILSRCMRFDFKLLPVNLLAEHLKNVFDKRGISYDEKSLHLIAKAGEGSVRDMLSIADSVAAYCNNQITCAQAESVIGLSSKESIKDILTCIANKDINKLFTAVHRALGSGKNIQVLCKEMADFIKNLIMIKVGVGDYSVLDILPGEFATYNDIASQFDLAYLKTAFSRFANVELDLKYSINPENLFESTCLDLIAVASTPVAQPTATVQPTAQPVSAPKVVEPVAVSSNEIDKVWGNVLIKAKERNLFALSNALINVVKVEKKLNRLVLHTNDLGCFQTIDNNERLAVILELINLFDDSIKDVEVIYDKTNASVQDVKDSLKDAFKSKIRFKE